MSKLKGFLFLLLVVIVVIFALANQDPVPTIRIFTVQIGTLPTYLLTYLCLVLGFLVGWVAHVFRIRRKRLAAAAVAGSAQEKQDPHQDR
jgi:uncharacterized integral membrane protein